MTSVSVVVVGYGDEPHLETCLKAIQSDLREGDDIALVDNGITKLPGLSGARRIRPVSNVGFGAACNLGAANTTGDVLIFVNSDAVVTPGTIDALRRATQAPDVGLVTGLVVLADRPEIVNTAGNPVHYLGISWSGGLGDPTSTHQNPTTVASVSGALFAIRRREWKQIGGFDPVFFMYHEDTDLSLRCWMAGFRVTYEPSARAAHFYEFSRNTDKLRLLERNRLIIIFTLYQVPTLLMIGPALLAFEVAVTLLAARQGWLRDKLWGWAWIGQNLPQLLRRRRRLSSMRTLSDQALLSVLTGDLAPGAESGFKASTMARLLLRAYWAVVLQILRPISRL